MRIYTKELRRWTATNEAGREITTQIEWAYKDLNEAGEILATGSEDFSPERERSQMAGRFVYTWDGEKRNKGGYRWFDYRGHIRYRAENVREVKTYLAKKYGAALVELR